MPYEVFDNNEICEEYGDPTYDRPFETWDKAVAFAKSWLGALSEGVTFEKGKAFDYSGFGDMLEIREVSDEPYCVKTSHNS